MVSQTNANTKETFFVCEGEKKTFFVCQLCLLKDKRGETIAKYSVRYSWELRVSVWLNDDRLSLHLLLCNEACGPGWVPASEMSEIAFSWRRAHVHLEGSLYQTLLYTTVHNLPPRSFNFIFFVLLFTRKSRNIVYTKDMFEIIKER